MNQGYWQLCIGFRNINMTVLKLHMMIQKRGVFFQSICSNKSKVIIETAEDFSFDLYTSNDDSSFWKKWSFWLKEINSIKELPISKLKLSKVRFWSKPKMQNRVYTKSLNLELYRYWSALCLYCYYQSLISGTETGTRICLHPNLRFFKHFLIS